MRGEEYYHEVHPPVPRHGGQAKDTKWSYSGEMYPKMNADGKRVFTGIQNKEDGK